MPVRPSVSLIIPAYNEEATIERCLLAAVSQIVPAAEIIVVDNRSTDRTALLAERVAQRYPGAAIRVVQQSKVQGLIPTRNFGFAQATGQILGRIDADTVLEPNWVARVAAAMSDPTVGAVTGPVRYYDLPFRGAGEFSDDLVRRVLRGVSGKYPFLYGSNMAMRADAWRAIEHAACLDPDDLLHEDIDLSVHLRDADFRVAYASDMQASVSARRLQTSPASFRDYTDRFERTYARHQIHHWYLKAPAVLLRAVYWLTRSMRAVAPARAAVTA
ncbi:glycosyltransferase [Microbacterium lushaniae]|uniref:Glycosyltransferase n=1 Tax=Microbacterium lushaniae TaxID=2614639 RepID=A0A5J6L724_9MICO|nr:glycosyltransferase family 2 protein [Microbacterium lushaniae]QEW04245.1 glycosyltransferase [Microbacterium lushaniae]